MKLKFLETVNPLTQNYIKWAERQDGRGVKRIMQRSILNVRSQLPVHLVLMDRGGEYVTNNMEAW